MPMLQFGPRREVDAETIIGNVYLGDFTINALAAAPSVEPRIGWITPAPDDPEYNLLLWKARLADLEGRDTDMKNLLDWARDGRPVRARFLSGVGGVGKTRLAAELADRLRADGWSAGFVNLRKPGAVPVNRSGVLLILDYPEEQSGVDALLSDLAELDPPEGGRVRLLFLSRLGAERWGDTVRESGASPLFGRMDLPPLSAFTDPEQAWRVFQTARARTAKLTGQSPGAVDRGAFDAWFARNPLHGRPLFVGALAIQSVREPGRPATDLTGPDVIQALVERERRRLRPIAEQHGMDEDAPIRLAALAAVRGGLDAAKLDRLSETPGLKLGLGDSGSLYARLSAAGLLRDGAVPPPEPDIVAAALTVDALSKPAHLAPERLWAAIDGAEAEAIARVGQLSYDAEFVLRRHECRLRPRLESHGAGSLFRLG